MNMLCTLRSATETQLQSLREAPTRLESFLEDEEDFDDAKGAAFLELDIGEAWHGLQFLLTDTAWEGTPPLDFLVRGGEDVGDIPSDEGTARVFDAAGVKALAEALKTVSEDTLRQRFDPARLQAEDIYPGTWEEEEPAEDVDPLEELVSYFVELRKFTAAVAKRGHALLVHIG
ncbi:YfbM family protein [Corallococcus sp. bb12-1]|uniref:YfbM family protein n=1 Tax=Corallococcus sp. bb12-1 TaxID=2996784 RepID=UPI00226DB2E0|nr:YfbM family protein [Corallococcus sp. bb12-1]MCY1044270.1 YfbM family protein [Corallococcus sp. bb12-1]